MCQGFIQGPNKPKDVFEYLNKIDVKCLNDSKFKPSGEIKEKNICATKDVHVSSLFGCL